MSTGNKWQHLQRLASTSFGCSECDITQIARWAVTLIRKRGQNRAVVEAAPDGSAVMPKPMCSTSVPSGEIESWSRRSTPGALGGLARTIVNIFAEGGLRAIGRM